MTSFSAPVTHPADQFYACLVRMSELHDRARVFTLDADFKLSRRQSRQTIPLLFSAPQ